MPDAENGDSGAAPDHLVPGGRWTHEPSAPRVSFSVLVVLALALHLMPFALALTSDVRIGARADSDEGIMVQLIDTSEFERPRDPPTPDGLDRSAAAPADGAPPSPPAPPPEPPQPAAAASPQPTPAPVQPPQPPATPGPKSPATQDFAEVLTTPLDSTFKVPPMQNKSLDLAPPPMKSWAPPPRPNQPEMSQLERYIERRNRPSRTRGGETDVFTSAIAGILERAKPTFPGVGGQVVIEFVVSETGRMEGLRLAQSSGQPKLDDLVLRSVARVQLVPPPAGTTLRDRTFEITYSYK